MAYDSIELDGPVGQSLVRVSGREKVTGSATFTAEWPIEKLLHCVAVPANIPHGKILSIDTSAAEAMSGVRLVITPDNAPKMTQVKSGSETNFETSISSCLYPASENEIFFAGQYVAAVVADTFESARDAALAVKVQYESKPHTTNMDIAPDDEKPKSLMGAPPLITIGDAEKALRDASIRVDHDYPTDANYHNAIEPHAAIAQWSIRHNKPFLTVYETSQSLPVVAASYAKLFGLGPKQVRVVCKYVGGAFGSKGLTWPNAMLAVMAAKMTGQAVKCVATRRQMYGGTGHRTAIRQRVAIGATAEGKIQSVIHTGFASTAIKDTYTEAFTMATRMMLDTPNLRLEQTQNRLHTQIPTFMRAPAETPGMFALESAIDELAVELSIDPIEIRRINEPAKDIHSGKPFSSRLLVDCLDKGAEAFRWSQRKPKPRSEKEGHWWIGRGVASATYPYFTFPTKVDVTWQANGTVVIECCTHEIGTGVRTAIAQLLADLLDIPVSRVSMEIGDTALPPGGITGGSATTASVGGAIRLAVEQLKRRLVNVAEKESPLHTADPKSIQFKNGNVVCDDHRFAVEDVLSQANKTSVMASGHFKGEKDSPTSNHSFGATFVEVGVDDELGLVRVRRMLGCYACGTILNARTARSQFIGGLIFGVGHALQESVHWDHRYGRITNDNLAEYHVPVNADIPDIDILWIDNPDFNASPIGAKGIGEISITGVAAAVANAVYNAIGKRIRSLPITAEKVMA